MGGTNAVQEGNRMLSFQRSLEPRGSRDLDARVKPEHDKENNHSLTIVI
jgi:hypothetical protein